ncbi:polyketide synthase [Eremomyces bilateralis CBS 781.70]|uniref:Polyketide synthase n=1 Tax=Eremomyces bilateralis CBS 781.70 TaxID=1392243 RepID=A0A6G1G3E8_9PEZI|nr:polyketide synthase [Eremomyces bilateralis CBS 781.70]KAF1812538.1 polyketide synthase [Eremomyces bilateralis CBS 781.70]
MNTLVFGDQTADQYPLLRKVTTRKDNALLATFLERAAVALREEIQRLPRSQREEFPDFLTMNQLVEAYYEKGVRLPQIESCFVTVAQLAHFIGYYGENPSELPNASNTRILGLCTGLLAGSAVACSRSLSDLLPLSVQVLRISFRVGTLVAVAKSALTDSNESWSTIVTGTSHETAQKALDKFHAENSIPNSSRAYISAISVMALTISGPPATTQRIFKESEALNKNHRVGIPIFAPYHAPHLYSDAERANILGTDSFQLKQFIPNCLIHSAATGKCHSAANALELVHIALEEILQKPVRWDYLLEDMVSQITMFPKSEATIHAIGITNIANSLLSGLKAGGQTHVSVRDHASWVENDKHTGRTQNDKIAIVGMSGRFPNAADHEALWDLLMKGLDVHREIPKDRFDAKAHCDPSGKGKNKSHTPYGCFIDEPGLFDPRFFNMSPREAAQTDPMGRLALVTAYEALEMSGCVPNRTPSTKLHRIGTFYGQTSDDWREINAAENVDTYFITGGVRAFATGRINYYFKFSGPSFSIDTACSSSLAAIQLACTSLWAGDCDTACAGGLNVLTNPDIFAGLSKGQFLSKTGSCKTYDNDADGYCRGDGCGTVILKRYEDAIADNDNILGCILGASTNHSAEAISITHPHAGAQEFLYKKVLAEAGVDPHDISYVEMHGTGTQAGDGIEMTSVTNSFAPCHRRRRPEQTLHLGAIKANVGHAEAASGINSLIKVMLMMQKNAIPANVGIKGEINKTFPKDLSERNVHISQSKVAWPRKGAEKRRAFLNNFSAAGGNTAIVLEDGPLREAPKGVDPRGTHLISVSARSIASLKRNLNNLMNWLRENPSTTLPSLAYTTTARRIQHNYRIAFTASDMSQVSEGLGGQLKDTYSPIAMVPTEVAFTFTGQGSQYTALAKKLFEELSSFRADIEQLDKLARIQGLPSFIPILDGTDVATLSPVVVQLGLACIQVALARMWASWGVKPVAVIGHSLGEYAALHVAGVLSASDMILLVGRRAEILVANCTEYTHGMLAVKASVETLSSVLGSKMTEVACVNSPEETVLCGSTDVIASTADIVAAQGFKATKLNVPFAFHSAQVGPIMDSFKSAAASVVFNKPSVPVLSPLTGEVIREQGVIGPNYLARHARETVNFWTALTAGQESKAFNEKTTWLEIGAHPVTSAMVKSSLLSPPTTAYSLRRNEDPWKSLTSNISTLYLAGVAFDFNEYHREFNDAHELYVLPTYSFDNKTYWLDYHHNWTLTKGEAPFVPAQQIEAPKVEQKPKLSTTSLQKIVNEEFHANSGTVIFQSDMHEPTFKKAVEGHIINGVPLCPSSIYADMAFTAADYLYKQLRPGASDVGLNCCSMEVHKPLMPLDPVPDAGQHLQLVAKADLEVGEVHLTYRSTDANGKLILEHGHGLVKYENKETWREEWLRVQFMVQTQIDLLKSKLASGNAHKILRGMAYKLFASMCKYEKPYQGMEEVILDAHNTEATAKVRFQNTKEDGDFFCAPFWIDSLCHLSGFIVNGSDLCNPDSGFISHGWSNMRFSKPFSLDGVYQSYVRLLPGPRKTMVGDVYILEGDEIIAVTTGLKFQEIPRKALAIMLPSKEAVRKMMTQGGGSVPAKSAPATEKAPVKTLSASVRAIPAPRPKVENKVAQKRPSGGNTITARVMKIIAAETDVDMSELVDEAAFDNLGVDSLMSLTISAKFREDLDLEISSALFTDYPTVGAMKKFFGQYDGDAPLIESDDSDISEQDAITPFEGEGDGTSTPASSAPSFEATAKSAVEVSVIRTHEVSNGAPSIARQTVAEEMGVTVSEITDTADLAELGMDSLMSLTILGSLREKTGVDLPSTFLTTNPTIEDIENALGMRPKPKGTIKMQAKVEAKPPNAAPTSPQLAEVNRKLHANSYDVSKFPPATSVLLQGNAKIATKKLFLFPDGSGSATSYISIPNISPDVAVFGLNCPFMKTPAQFTCGIEGVSAIYLAEVRRRQPSGPYFIGGWSAGGVVAYEVALQLMAAGEKVERLILLDSPCPVKLEPLPARLHHFFESIGLLGTGKAGGTPGWLLPHFESCIKALSAYEPAPMPKGIAPSTLAIWATDGVCGKPGDPRPPPAEGEDPKPMKWLLDNRTDFGDNGWAQLLGDEALTFRVMGGNHFTMMRDEHGNTLCKLIKEGMGLTD